MHLRYISAKLFSKTINKISVIYMLYVYSLHYFSLFTLNTKYALHSVFMYLVFRMHLEIKTHPEENMNAFCHI